MLTIEEQLARVLALAKELPSENVHIGGGFGRVLAEDVVAALPVPPFTNSAMDGFAVRAEDLTVLPVRLPVVADIPAGATQDASIGAGQAARIMTGAPLPEGADAVVPVEDTDQPVGAAPVPSVVEIRARVTSGRHVRRVGEDVGVGEPVLTAGERWTPAAAAAAASVGRGEVWLRRRPRIAVLATGDELVAPGAPLGYGAIPDSNSVLLTGLAAQFGAEVVLARRVRDDVGEFRATLTEALSADVVVTAGGVSAGAFEVVRQAVEGEVVFVKVAMQPGKPQALGALTAPDGRRVPMLGLPGNPVSVFVSAWVFLRPLLARLGGWSEEWPGGQLPAAQGWRCPPSRRQFVPVVITPEGVRPAHRLGSGSHLIASLHAADALAVVPEDVAEVRPGDVVECRFV